MSSFRPSPEQQAIIEYPLEPLRVDAGAGTGKTTTMALRLTHLVDTGQVRSALGVTFTNKAAEELRERIFQGRGSEEVGDVEISTYHGFAHAILNEFGAYVGVERTSRLITPGFVRQLMTEALLAGSYSALDLAAPSHRVEEMAALGGQIADNLGRPGPASTSAAADLGDVAARRSELLAALSRYEQIKRRLGLVDYGDLIRLAHRVVTREPLVAAQIRARHQVVLLDEYQDTNPAQRELLRAVFGDGFPVTAVGDADQTIYEWRGASLENFAAFPEHFPRSDGAPAETLPLTLNRRSGTDVLDAANLIAGQIGVRSGHYELSAPAGVEAGDVGVAWFRTATDEARWIADSILEEVSDGRAWRDLAVIFRKNAQIPLIRSVLAADDIPVQVVSLGGLLHVPEVADLWAWLRILDDPSDGPAFLRIVLGAHYQLGLGDLVPLARWVEAQDSAAGDDDPEIPGFSLAEAVFAVPELDRPAATAALDRFRSRYTELVEHAQGVTLIELCRRVLATHGVWIEVDSLTGAAARSARLNLYRFLDLAESWSPLEGRPSLTAFLGYLATLQDEAAPEELDLARIADADAVTLITVHRAKGLEWDVVFLPAVVTDTFPARLRAFDDPFSRPAALPFEQRLDAASLPVLDPNDDQARRAALRPRHLDQEWRTAYVAATRAKRRLAMSGAYWYGQRRPKQPSALFEVIESLPTARSLHECDDPGERPAASAISRTPVPAPDPHFPRGWEESLRQATMDPDRGANRAGTVPAYDDHVNQLSLRLDSLTEPADDDATGPSATSVSGLVTYATCPQRFYWLEVDRLPRRPSPWLKRGVELHRRIELHNRGVVPLDLVDDQTYDFGPDELSEPRADAYTTFQESRFGQVKPRWVEVPFILTGGELRIRGRIDAVYDEDGRWEVVDFKSGRHRPDPARLVQLQAYALAVEEGALGGEQPEALTVTFAYFGDGLEEVSASVDDDWMATARQTVTDVMAGIAQEAFAATPSPACHHCDFDRFCQPGQAWLADNR